MRIVVTNDDGVEAAGIEVLEEIAHELSDDVWVVAPETDNSGASHSLTLAEPLRLRELGQQRYAVKGTPTDCVIMAVRSLLLDHPPDLILSGVNRGQNVADDVTYSGTVAGAIEGTLLGIRSIALSLVTGPMEQGVPIWETPLTHGAKVVRQLLDTDWTRGVLLNVNFPDCQPDEVTGVEVTRMGQRSPDLLNIDDRMDTRGKAYYWIGVNREMAEPPEGTDIWAVRNKAISVTPLCLDFTHQPTCEQLQKALKS
ncbi:5'-nucleotidase SurE [Methyloligella halotolerans]|uniref:5'-nucleotidase SurE n=1 Tax=Methyloligella halotolerans TaxID=1177755 RepID=A0A1E2S2S4_9HYPH|nr:5'/3'-nucleotidase SurE [Methyloligella halotolerans]ODA68744.1 5'-nucleotidase SurE [Methyloligella halotolerans]